MFYKVQRIYNDVRCWFRHCFNKHHWKVIKEAILGYPFDYCYLWELEKAKLVEMQKFFEESNITIDDPKTAKEINLAIKLLDIMLFEDDLYEFNHRTREYECLVKVNTNNIDRFIFNQCEKNFILDKMPHELYVVKAKHLYYELMKNKIRGWWN